MIFSALRLRHPATLILLLLSFELEAQSLLLNSGFDTNLDQWNLGGLVSPVWDSSDANNNPGSGSALIKNTFPDAFSDEAVLTQCLFDGAGGYELGVHINIPSGQTRTGSVVILRSPSTSEHIGRPREGSCDQAVPDKTGAISDPAASASPAGLDRSRFQPP